MRIYKKFKYQPQFVIYFIKLLFTSDYTEFRDKALVDGRNKKSLIERISKLMLQVKDSPRLLFLFAVITVFASIIITFFIDFRFSLPYLLVSEDILALPIGIINLLIFFFIVLSVSILIILLCFIPILVIFIFEFLKITLILFLEIVLKRREFLLEDSKIYINRTKLNIKSWKKIKDHLIIFSENPSKYSLIPSSIFSKEELIRIEEVLENS
jgi:hypothetical protein